MADSFTSLPFGANITSLAARDRLPAVYLILVSSPKQAAS